jgi:hypothetical protein
MINQNWRIFLQMEGVGESDLNCEAGCLNMWGQDFKASLFDGYISKYV